MSQRRVVITGMGWVTPLGSDLDGVWAKLARGASAIGPVLFAKAQEVTGSYFAVEIACWVMVLGVLLLAALADNPQERAGVSAQTAPAADGG